MSHRCIVAVNAQNNFSSQELAERLRNIDASLSELERLISRLTVVGDREEYQQQIINHRRELQRNYGQLRATILHCMRQIDERQREWLFDGDAIRQRTSAGMREQAVASNDALAALLQRMDVQVASAATTLQTLAESSSRIKSTEKEMSHMASHIQQSGKLLAKLDRRELTDRILISVALVMFLLTCAYIIKKRLFGHALDLW